MENQSRINGLRRCPAAAAVMLALLGLSACDRGTALVPTSTADPKAGPPAPSFTQFNDIPVPQGATMDLTRTLLLGGQDAWLGRLVFASKLAPSQVFDFYKAELGQFGWAEITSVRSETSVLTYQRADRVATVEIRPQSLGGSEVFFTVSPQGAGAASGPLPRR